MKTIFSNIGIFLAWIAGIIASGTAIFKTIQKLIEMNKAKRLKELESTLQMQLSPIIKSQSQLQTDINSIIYTLGEHSGQLGMLHTICEFILANSNSLWYVCDEKGHTVKVAPQTCKYLGLSESELMGTNWVNHIPLSEHKAIFETYAQSIEDKRDFNYTYSFKKGNGKAERFNTTCKWTGKDWFGILIPAVSAN